MNDKIKKYIRNEIMDSYKIKKMLWEDDVFINTIKIVAERAIKVYKNKNKILIAGNGGSAADAQHIACELVSRFKLDRPGLPAVALTTDTSIITSIGNDYGYDHLFQRQIQANGMAGDMFIGITTSGKSINIIKAFEACKEKGISTVGITGKVGGKIEELCDYCIKVPSNETPRIQECHIMIGHIICAIIEKKLFGEEG